VPINAKYSGKAAYIEVPLHTPPVGQCLDHTP
jgi:hypothetical protein